MVARLGRIHVSVKAVGIFHDELARAHHAKARAALIAELGLNMVKIARHLLVALDLLARNVSHHLFAGGLDDEVAAMPVFHAKQLGAHLLEATRLLPVFSGLDDRHQHLHRPGAVHFLAHDGLNLAHHAQAQRHVGVDARTELFDHAGAHHQLVADHLSIGGGLFLSRDKKLRGFHEVFSTINEQRDIEQVGGLIGGKS